jgi:hypothetical protein
MPESPQSVNGRFGGAGRRAGAKAGYPIPGTG